MNAALWFVVTLLALDAGLIAALLTRHLGMPFTAASVLDIGPLLVAAGVLTALIAFLVNLRRARSDDILKTATDLLEKAYETLMPKDDSSEPTNRRLSWLSAARLIATAERLEKAITENSHLLVYREKKEYWRTRLYELIFPSPPDGLPSSFYAEKPEHMIAYSGRVRDPLSEKSVAFLYRFIRWPETVRDPLGEEPAFTDAEIERMQAFGPRGLGKLLGEVRSLKRAASER
ncbi:MAG TPA: hypothetical protein DCP03_00345 [Polaromonas sp.]|uniref:hypothetical protein n=1 Tax=Polaromonas sp. UBA4122 TaxID=1947074 RepID=UPI000EE9995C|nr:hypothetical protein [Polaromonas sp. UBA4122]HAL36643.1 hypothetical protein [Polaromonas sp.]